MKEISQISDRARKPLEADCQACPQACRLLGVSAQIGLICAHPRHDHQGRLHARSRRSARPESIDHAPGLPDPDGGEPQSATAGSAHSRIRSPCSASGVSSARTVSDWCSSTMSIAP